MSSGKAFPPRLFGGQDLIDEIREPGKWCAFEIKFKESDTEYLSIEEHSAILSEKDAEIQRLRNFIVKVRRSSTCPATVLVAGQVLDGHDVAKEALAGGKDE